ncbi:hypothetical protein BU14_0283s0011 [Porphyra umbilicalis]|uniref:Uncharacterized protein n=1 Tax=Porphyra umbilicalis TaxID=2786 RepID=A0A1X6P132_PORUM|nr:hypothetical protein BU14_0283s0011 [Porphyra umbilicalis]|eukprot:OSX74579.1 hypothetical protein BU14_0283s0011 [Porphyra umbilicalis]
MASATEKQHASDTPGPPTPDHPPPDASGVVPPTAVAAMRRATRDAGGRGGIEGMEGRGYGRHRRHRQRRCARRRAAAAPRRQTTRAAPLPRTSLQVQYACTTPPSPVARPWPPRDSRGVHAGRCVGGGVGGSTPRRAVAGR